MLPNFQFSIFNFQSIFKIKILPILLLFLFSTFYFLSSARPILAQGKTSPPPSPNVETNVPDTLHNWTQTVMIEVMSSLSCQLTGIDPVNPEQNCLEVDQKNGKIGFYPSDPKDGKVGGAVGAVGSGITMLFNFPVHTADYVQNLAQNFGITKKTYAQQTGTGFESLKPLLGIWTAFRNIVYLIFVIVFVVIGLAIMLRVKIDPRTVMTIQNQIPKIIIGILLVTFSYAIGGFLIDMMYVSIHVIGNVVISADPTLSEELPTQLSKEPNPFVAVGHVGANTGNAFFGLWNIIKPPSSALGDAIVNVFNPVINFASEVMIKGVVGALMPSGDSWANPLNWFDKITGFVLDPITKVVTGLLSKFFGFIFTLLALVVVSIALLIALFKLWFSLIFAYINILLGVALAPFWIIGGLFPGSPINVSGWLKSMVANLAAFPVTIAMFLLGKVFMGAFGQEDSPVSFVPPLIGDRATFGALGSIIGLGIILMTPNVVTMLKQALKVQKFDTGLGKSIGAGVSLPTKAIQSGAGLYGAATFDISGEKKSAGRGGRIFQKFFRS